MMPPGIQWGRNLTNTAYSRIDVGHNLVDAHSNNNVFRAKDDTPHPIAHHVEINKLAVGGKCISTRQEKVGKQRLTPPLDNLCPLHSVFKCVDE